MNTLPTRRSIIGDAVSGLGSARGPHLSIRGGRFRLIAANGEERLLETHYVDVLILDSNQNTARVYFDGPYDPGADLPPVCFSDNGTGPSTASMAPQAPTCAVCPHNVRGSDQTFSGKPTTACDRRKKLAFIIPEEQAVTVYEFQIPPGSLGGLTAYAGWIDAQKHPTENRKCDINDFITRVSFDPARQFVLQFTASAWADDDASVQKTAYVIENHLSDVAVGRNDMAIDPQAFRLTGPAQQPAIAPPAQPAPTAQFQLPPRLAAPAQLPPPPVSAPAPPPATPKPRGRRAPPPAAAPATAPFIAPAAPAQPPMAAAPSLDVPEFLRRTPAAPPPAVAPTPRFGVAEAPPPPAAVQDALNDAMNLPTRR